MIAALVLAAPATHPAAASIDATGIFAVTGVPGLSDVSMRQVGTKLTMCGIVGGQVGRVAAGTIDPSTGAFTLSWTLLGPGGLGAYCSVVWAGTFASDGSSFTAQVKERSTCVPPPFTCHPQCVDSASYPIAGSRTQMTAAPCCADGV